MNEGNYVRPIIELDMFDAMTPMRDIRGEAPLNDPNGVMNWISNARRDDMIAALREFIAIGEGYGHRAPDATQ